MIEPSRFVYQFASFELNSETGELRKGEINLHLQPQPTRILLLLVQNAGHLVSREEVRKEIWGDDTFVDFEQSLNFCIRQIRAALNDDPEKPLFVETLPRRGYRFIAGVKALRASSQKASAEMLEAPVEIAAQNKVVAAARRYWLALGAGLLALGVVTFVLVRQRVSLRTTPTVRINLAVLPFQNLDGDPKDDYLSDGLTEEMITQLGALEPSRLGVIARTTAMQYRTSSKRVDQIGRELGVEYVLEGSVRREGYRIRISCQLIETGTQTHLWARDYDRELRDVLVVEAEVSQSVANSIQVRLTPESHARLATAGTVNPVAFDAYLKGRYLWNGRTTGGLEKSVGYFQEAIAKQPDYALAYAGLADTYNIFGNFGLMPPKQAYPQAKAAATHALEIDSSLAEAQVALSFAQFLYDWDWTAEDGFRKAIQLNPNYGPAHQWYGVILISRARDTEAMAEEERAQQAEPYSLIIHSVKGWVAYLAHHYDDAILACRQALELDPNFAPAHGYLGRAYEAKGMYPEAIRELEKSVRASARPNDLGSLAYAYAGAGRRDEARKLITEFERRAQSGYFPAWEIAIAYAGMGDRDQAFAWLEKAYEERCPWFIHLETEPRFESLHDDPRFQSLVRRVGLPP
jgi:TolB-like protein/DNA-binding winged helix-turn-helix (wHTH) protein/tetratricopeptide (TPR) repeat protein